jgi:two-component sensor histidine kinase
MIFGNLINLGVKSEMDFYQMREARIVNLFALITLFGLLIGVSTVFFISGDYALPTVVFSAVTSILILVFNYKTYYNTATYLFVISISFTIFILNEQYVKTIANYLYYFPIIFCVALIHNPLKSNLRTAIFFIIVALSFLASRLLTIPSLENMTLSQEDKESLLVYNVILSFIITVILVYLVVKLINRQNDEAIGLLKKEQEAQIKISQSLKEKDVMLAEIQHRVKNNLAIITSLLNLQSEKAPCEVSKQLMIDSRNRVMSMAMVHENLYRKDNLSKIDLEIYISELVLEISKSFLLKNPQVIIQEELEKVEVEITRAVPIGLIVNEAITNSLKHAFDHSIQNPTIKIMLHVINGKVEITLQDNGVGFAEDKEKAENSLGLSLMESLADQIDAKILFTNNPGACLKLIFTI